VDNAGECQPDPDKPCPGNPVKNPRIAPQTNSGVDGGRFGEDARKIKLTNGKLIDKPHYGLDLKNEIDGNVYSPYNGNIVTTGVDEDGWGKWIMVKSSVNGKNFYFLFAHLKEFNQKSGQVNAGEILGKAGETGNLADAKNNDIAIQHLHIETREIENNSSWNKSKKRDPEDLIKTKFNKNGEVKSSTDC